MIPNPPGTFLSIHRIGKGFNISNTRNKANPPTTKIRGKRQGKQGHCHSADLVHHHLFGILLHLYFFSRMGDPRGNHNQRQHKGKGHLDMSNNEIAQHRGNAASDPKVPGATGENPIRPPVARNTIVFCLTVSTWVNFMDPPYYFPEVAHPGERHRPPHHRSP